MEEGGVRKGRKNGGSKEGWREKGGKNELSGIFWDHPHL